MPFDGPERRVLLQFIQHFRSFRLIAIHTWKLPRIARMLGFNFAALPKSFEETYHYFTAEIYRRTKCKVISTTGAFL